MSRTSSDHEPDDLFSFPDVLQEECERLHLHHDQARDRFRRQVDEIKAHLLTAPPATPNQHKSQVEAKTKEHAARRAIYQTLHSQSIKSSALCFSGGGIRSATFNLGVIQALAKLNLLDKFDYLSTVSGGGYIGAWLTTWIHRLTPSTPGTKTPNTPTQTSSDLPQEPQRIGIKAVQSILKQSCSTNGSTPCGHEPAPLTWLRTYSNYLTPKLGVFSADSWTMIGTALRNLILNWLVLLPLLIAALMVPRIQIAWISQSVETSTAQIALWGGLALSIPTLIYLHLFRPSLRRFRCLSQGSASNTPKDQKSLNPESQNWFIWLAVLPLMLSGYCLTTAWAWYRNSAGPGDTPGLLSALTFDGFTAPVTFAIVAGFVHMVGWGLAMLILFIRRLTIPKDDRPPWFQLLGRAVREILVIAAAGGVGGYAVWAMLSATPSDTCPGNAPTDASCHLIVTQFAEWYAAFAVPGFLGTFLLVATLFIGIAGRFAADQDHEFWGRAGSWILNVGTSLGLIGAAIIFGPGVLAKLGGWTMASVGGISGVLTLIGGFSAKTLFNDARENTRSSRVTDVVMKIATPLFVVLLIIGLALGTSAVVKGWSWLFDGDEGIAWINTGMLMPEPSLWEPWIHSLVLHNARFDHLVNLWLLLIATGVTMGWFINVNKFSLHGFYRNRLIQAYLGASNDNRRPNSFTGFADNDNIQMRDLSTTTRQDDKTGRTTREPKLLQKPFHIVNIALNLVQGSNLAWQQRKALSFTVSPLHCGSWQELGYRSSVHYGYNKHVDRAITMGTAIATSGAAASPNMGYHSSTAVTFLMALFNIRLGWWLGNPGEAGGSPPLRWLGLWFNRVVSCLPWQTLRHWLTLAPAFRRACPGFSIWPLLAELFGFTTARSRYVYLSDGGHFENLALYEMVLRRSHHIVVIDAGCDPEMAFQDLGNAIRKIRIDQGVDIEIDTAMLKRQSGASVSRWHHAIGSIRYDKVDDGAPIGTLIYIKPSLTGDEPSDIQDYLAHHPTFPHEPTSDQFFDEAQFESYRRLGEHITWEVFRHGFK